MTTLLIADLHLQPARPEITAGFLHWLENRASGADALYILGDFFEAWIGDDVLDLDDTDPTGYAALALRVAAALRRLGEDGTRVLLMHGNRDFLLGHRFADTASARLIPDPSVIDIGGAPILLMHGDSLCTTDDAYMAFRKQARDPRWQQQVLAMPINDRLALASQLRQQSGEANSNKAKDIMDVTPAEVISVMRDQGVTTLIHGHTHRPAVHQLDIDGKPAQRFVLGDWQPDKGWEIAVEDGGEPALREFDI